MTPPTQETRRLSGDELAAILDPFQRLYLLNQPLEPRADAHLSRYIPGVWPSWGEFAKLVASYRSMLDTVAGLEAENARLAAALTIYADDEHWPCACAGAGDDDPLHVHAHDWWDGFEDGPSIAKDALSGSRAALEAQLRDGAVEALEGIMRKAQEWLAACTETDLHARGRQWAYGAFELGAQQSIKRLKGAPANGGQDA